MEAREAQPVERKRLTDVGVGFNKKLACIFLDKIL